MISIGSIVVVVIVIVVINVIASCYHYCDNCCYCDHDDLGADRASLEVWHTSYYSVMESLLRDGRSNIVIIVVAFKFIIIIIIIIITTTTRFVGKDQSVMAATCLSNPGLCLLVKSNGNWFYLQV